MIVRESISFQQGRHPKNILFGLIPGTLMVCTSENYEYGSLRVEMYLGEDKKDAGIKSCKIGLLKYSKNPAYDDWDYDVSVEFKYFEFFISNSIIYYKGLHRELKENERIIVKNSFKTQRGINVLNRLETVVKILPLI